MRVVGQRVIVVGGLALALALLWTVPAQGLFLPFEYVDGGGDDISGQLLAYVTDEVADFSSPLFDLAGFDEDDLDGFDVHFLFQNDVGAPSSVTAVYFSDPDGLLNTDDADVGLTSSTGVSFAPPATPSGFHSLVVEYSADSNNPGPQNGINTASEWLIVSFSYASPGTLFTQILASLAADPGDGIQVGLRVQSQPNGGSSQYLAPSIPDTPPQPPEVIPEPATFLLLGMGVAGIVARRMRMRA